MKFLKNPVIMASVGTILEWYDFGIYAYLISVMASVFFPGSDRVASVMQSFGVFAIGYLMRPLGSIFLGAIGDKYGRRAMLTISITLMGLGSGLIGLLPSYAKISIWAPILIIFFRMIQGFSLGGEYTGAMTYTTEASIKGRRGFISSLVTSGAFVGISLASFINWVVRLTFQGNSLHTVGWRIPFLIGALVSMFGLWIRRNIPETHDGSGEHGAADYICVLFSNIKLLLKTVFIVASGNVAFYIVSVFMIEYLGAQYKDRAVYIQGVNTVIMILYIFLIPLGGWLSDKFGRKKISMAGLAVSSVLAVPCCFHFLSGEFGPVYFFILQLAMAVPIAVIFGVQGAMMAELMPASIRCRLFSLSYSLSMAFLAGTSPLVSEWMVARHGWTNGPGMYIVFFSLTALIGLLTVPETAPRVTG